MKENMNKEQQCTNDTRFFDLSGVASTTRPTLQHIFDPDNGESKQQTTSPPRKLHSKVQFDADLEKLFYDCSPKPPVEEEEEIQPPPPPTKKERVLAYLHVKFPSRIVQRVLKCTIAYFISTLFCLIPALSQGALGPSPSLVTTGVLFSHPARSTGAQFDTTVTSVMGVLVAVAYAIAALAAGVTWNNHHLDTYINSPIPRVINMVFLFMGVMLTQMLRQIFPKFHFFSLQFMIIQIFTMTHAFDYTSIPYQLPLGYAIPLMIGHGIALAINLLFWPESAVDGLGRALTETLTSSNDMLHMITKQFFLDQTSEPVSDSVVNEQADKMRKGMVKVKSAYHEAKYETSYTYIRPQELGQIRKALSRLTRHLSVLGVCLKFERELFESAIEAIRAELMNESDDDYTTHESENEETTGFKRTYSEEDLNLLRTALRATNDHINGKFSRPTSRHTSANPSPSSSRPTSHPPSEDEEDREESDESDHNQKSVSSIRSFLHLSKLHIPKPKPPKKSKKQTEYNHRHLLMAYLESLRDPLMELALDCTSALECVCDSIAYELDMAQTPVQMKDWVTLIKHKLRLGKKKVDQDAINRKSLERHRGQLKCNCSQNIRLAVARFDKAEQDRMHALYKSNKGRMTDEALDLGMRQELFLVFFFIFTMREVADEVQDMTLHVDEIRFKAAASGKKHRKHLYWPKLNKMKWNKWAKGNNHQSTKDKGGYTYGALAQYIPSKDQKEVDDDTRLSKIQTGNSIRRSKSRRESNALLARKESRRGSSALAKLQSNQSECPTSPMMMGKRRKYPEVCIDLATVPTTEIDDDDDHNNGKNKNEEEGVPIMLKIRYSIWLKAQYLTRYEFKFALKMALAVAILCLPAFLPASQSWYTGVRGQWAALTVIAIMNPTSGGTVQASFWRIVGTIIGAMVGWAALEAGGGSPYLLALFAVLLAIPFFYIHLASTYNKVGIVTLVTYMVIALSRYANPVAGETIAETVWKRTITLIVGICVALLLNSLIWPFFAQHMVRKSVAGCMSQLEDYYTYLLGTMLYHDPNVYPSTEDLNGAEKLENKTQEAINVCSVLLELTEHEPRFKGPFPKEFYKEIINSMRNILDNMLSIRVSLLRMPAVVKHDICAAEYHADRRDMIAAVLLTFHTIGTSLRSKTPLPVYMPSPRAARTKLMDHRGLDRQKKNWVRFRNLTWFAMAYSTQEIIDELEYLTELVRYLVGESHYSDRARRIDDFVNTQK
ncbi:hypothetical protein K501DRAFT_231909 [Backusella circina FSU 941]|nr:hypothetical protein K501DRAFT_231909 [Backusella circina FSU 941]